MANLSVQGHSVNYSDNAREGVNYLFNLSYEKAKSIFESADVNGYVEFSYEGGGYKLSSSGGGIYSLSKKY